MDCTTPLPESQPPPAVPAPGLDRDFLRWRRKLQGIPEGFSNRFVQRLIVTLEDHPELVDALRHALGIPNRESPPQILPVNSDLPPAIARAHRGAVASRTHGRRHSA